MIRIDKEILEELDACGEGIEAFNARFPRGLRLPCWLPIHQAMVLGDEKLRPFWGWAVAEGLIPAWSMENANLVGANLVGANLYGANLGRANLYGANLDGANLYGANLDGANLYRANLDRANLDGANLDGANLYRANLDGAYRPTDPPPGWWPDGAGRLRRKEAEA